MRVWGEYVQYVAERGLKQPTRKRKTKYGLINQLGNGRPNMDKVCGQQRRQRDIKKRTQCVRESLALVFGEELRILFKREYPFLSWFCSLHLLLSFFTYLTINLWGAYSILRTRFCVRLWSRFPRARDMPHLSTHVRSAACSLEHPLPKKARGSLVQKNLSTAWKRWVVPLFHFGREYVEVTSGDILIHPFSYLG